MTNKVTHYRNKLQLTQSELAEKAGLSLRTVQRIESGNNPRGYTLKVLAKALETAPDDLLGREPGDEHTAIQKIRLINISALSFMVIPYGNIIFPLILISRNREARPAGMKILEIQILWSLITSLLLIASPFVQAGLAVKIPLLLIAFAIASLLNIYIILRNAIALGKGQELAIRLKNSIL